MEVKIIRSKKRTKTVSARFRDQALNFYYPENLEALEPRPV